MFIFLLEAFAGAMHELEKNEEPFEAEEKTGTNEIQGNPLELKDMGQSNED